MQPRGGATRSLSAPPDRAAETTSASGRVRRPGCSAPTAQDSSAAGLSAGGLSEPGLSERSASAAPLRGASIAAPSRIIDQAPPYAEADQQPDPSRYDDALYGQLDAGAQHAQHDPAYSDDPYAYQDGYDDGAEEPVQKRRGGMITVAVVLALAVVGTGAAFAYRTYVGSPRSGEPPIIKADTRPTKIVPAPADGNAKVPDRMAAGDGTEKIVPREEAPVDVNAKAGPRVVFPPLNQNANPPSPASVAPERPPPAERRQRHAAEQRAAQDQDLHGPR